MEAAAAPSLEELPSAPPGANAAPEAAREMTVPVLHMTTDTTESGWTLIQSVSSQKALWSERPAATGVGMCLRGKVRAGIG